MTAYPPMSFTDIIEYQPRIEPRPLAEPHVWMLPQRPTPLEFDADALIATYQRSAIVRTFERHKLTMDLVDELDALLDAYLTKAQRNR